MKTEIVGKNVLGKILSVSILILIILVFGCRKDPTPNVTFTASPTIVPYGSSSTISWNSTNVSSMTLNGKSVGASGSLFIEHLTKDTIFSLVPSDMNGTISTKSLTVNVTDDSLLRFLTQSHWIIDFFLMEDLSTGAWSKHWTECPEYWYFYLNGRFAIYYQCDTTQPPELIGDGSWNFLCNQTRIQNSSVFKDILVLNKDLFETVEPISGTNQPWKIFYKAIPNKK